MNFIYFFFLLCILPLYPQNIVLDKNSRCEIVIPEKPSKAEEYASNILSKYLKLTVNCEISIKKEGEKVEGIAIYIGKTKKVDVKEKIDEDGFIIDFPDKKSIVIYGGSDWGTTFGVYDFCERYIGIRWLFPGEIGEYIPKKEKIIIPLKKIKEEPYFISRLLSGRELFWIPVWEKEINDAQIWCNRLRMHGRINFHHNLLRLFPPSKYSKTNPDFFPIRIGERYLPPNDNAHGWQPCFSNEETIKEAIKNICEYFNLKPFENSYSLGVNDSSGYCECEKCLEKVKGENFLGLKNYSEIYYEWCNKVVEGVLKSYPDKYFGLLAYSEVIEPPGFKLNPHIIPFITNERLKWIDEEEAKRDKELTKKWKKFSKNIGWYDYIYGKPTGHYIIPRVWFSKMAEYLKFAYENNVKYYYAESYPDVLWREGPKLYITLKLLWNPYIDVEKTLDEWYKCAVGEKSAPYLKKYFEFWEEYWTKRIINSNWFKLYKSNQYLMFTIPDYIEVLRREDLVYCEDLLKKIIENTETEIERKRAEFFYKGFEKIKEEITPIFRWYILKEDIKKKVKKENLIFKNTFDTEKEKWSFWQRDYSKATSGYDLEEGYNSKGSIFINAENSAKSPLCFVKIYPCEVGKIYHFSGYYKSENLDEKCKINLGVNYLDEDKKIIMGLSKRSSCGEINKKEWAYLEMFFDVPQYEVQPKYLQLLLIVEGTNKGIVWFDDISFSEIETIE